MRIIETGICDIEFENIDKSKINLSNKIIKNVFPLIEDIKYSKSENLNSLKYELDRKTKKVKSEKDELDKLMLRYQKQKKVKKLLERISKIINAGLTDSGSYRREITILLKVIDTLSNDKLDYHLSETLKTINKRFGILI